MNLFALLERATARWPDKGAVYVGERKVWSFAELRSRALTVADSG